MPRFSAHIKDVGVIDANGKNWQGYDGVTLHKYDFVDIAFTNQKKSDSPHGYQCFSATATVSLKVTNTISTMSWIPTPSPCDQCLCTSQIDKWQELLKGHEATHAKLGENVKSERMLAEFRKIHQQENDSQEADQAVDEDTRKETEF